MIRYKIAEKDAKTSRKICESRSTHVSENGKMRIEDSRKTR